MSGRLKAVLLLLAALAVGWLGLLEPWRAAVAGLAAERAAAAERIAAHRRVAARAPEAARAAEAAEALAAAQLLPAGPDGALVAAFNRGLAAAVESVPERRLRLVGLDMAPPMAEGEAPDAPRRLSGRVTLEADLEGLAALLRALDAGRPRFVATALSVRPRLSGGERDLDVHIDLAALAPGAAS